MITSINGFKDYLLSNEYLNESFEGHLVHDGILMVKLSDKTKLHISKIEIPYNLVPLQSKDLHVTLVTIDNAIELPHTNFVLPDVIVGKSSIAQREDNTTFVVEIVNQNDFKKLVDEIYASAELENPEPDRYFHITIANLTGDPFDSIGGIVKTDFE